MSSNRFRSRPVRTDSYHLEDALPVAELSELAAGTNLLVSGPPMTGKQELALDLLAAGETDGHAIAVSPDTDSERLVDGFEAVGGDADRFHVVDCSGATGHGAVDDTDHIKYVGSPGDLTGIGMGIVKSTRAIGGEVEDGLRLAVLSLSTLLQYSGSNRVFSFLHTITGRVSAADYLGVATLDPTRHPESEVNTLTSLFDTVVEFQEAPDGTRQFRVLGQPDIARNWRDI